MYKILLILPKENLACLKSLGEGKGTFKEVKERGCLRDREI